MNERREAATRQQASTLTAVFSSNECKALMALRKQYRQRCERLDDGGLAHLRFLRWLVQTGRLCS